MGIKYKKEYLIDRIKNIYDKYNIPMSYKILEKEIGNGERKALTRIFGKWQNACKELNIPYGREKRYKTKLNKEKLRLGEEKYDTNGCLVRIVEYNNANDIIIEFQDEYKYKLHTNYNNWKNGAYKNPYEKIIFNVACVGNAITKINGIKKESYKVWYAMIQRCYKECYDKKPTYIDCYVCDEWLIFENFEKWYNENYYKVDNEIMNLDKDILVNNNKIYSPNTCCFVPKRLNILFVNTKRKEVIKEITDLYKNKIPDFIYDAIYKNKINNKGEFYE